MIRKGITISLLFVWTFQCMITFLIYKTERLIIRTENKFSDRSGKDSAIICFDNLHDINWERQNEEFEWKGNLYDVISIQHTRRVVAIHCYINKKEKSLVDNYKDHFKKTNEKENTPVAKKIKFADSILNEISAQPVTLPETFSFGLYITGAMQISSKKIYLPPDC